ncbi:MAG: conjugal transfer protein TraX [Clostridiales bacterium]|nr:conjugal transfer protein TraX [Clostridiales bacterium]
MSTSYKSIPSGACINGFELKMIAVVTMLIDHIGCVLFPGQMVFRYIGRIAFPIFVFLIVEGFYHTRSVRKYEIRLLIFALISEIPFDLAFNDSVLEFQSQNVFFTLFLGLLMMDLITRAGRCMGMEKGHWFGILILVIFVVAASLLKTDYSAGGILLFYCFYIFRDRLIPKYIGLFAISLLVFGPVECWSLLAVIPLLLYNGERGFRAEGGLYGGRAKGAAAVLIKMLFYIFYPVHLLILHFISLHPGISL